MVSLILRRTVRRPLKVKGEYSGKPYSQEEDVEFVFPKEYNKMLRPIFYKDFDYEAREENGCLTFILTPIKCGGDESLEPDETANGSSL
jgi:hypothetical protein